MEEIEKFSKKKKLTDIEIIKDCYRSSGVTISEDYLDGILKNPKRIEQFRELHKREKRWNMNYILGKPLENEEFTDFELKALSIIDLFDRKLVNICKITWDNRDNTKKLNEFLKQIKKGDKYWKK